MLFHVRNVIRINIGTGWYRSPYTQIPKSKGRCKVEWRGEVLEGWRVGEWVCLITSYLNTHIHTQSAGQTYVIFPKISCRSQIQKFLELKMKCPIIIWLFQFNQWKGLPIISVFMHNVFVKQNIKRVKKSNTSYFACPLRAGLVILRNFNKLPSISNSEKKSHNCEFYIMQFWEKK